MSNPTYLRQPPPPPPPPSQRMIDYLAFFERNPQEVAKLVNNQPTDLPPLPGDPPPPNSASFFPCFPTGYGYANNAACQGKWSIVVTEAFGGTVLIPQLVFVLSWLPSTNPPGRVYTNGYVQGWVWAGGPVFLFSDWVDYTGCI